jgi:hypothetical protein
VPQDKSGLTIRAHWEDENTLVYLDPARAVGIPGFRTTVSPAGPSAEDLAGKITELEKLKEAELETLAAEHEVQIPKGASKSTVLLLVAQAQLTKRAAK